MKIRSGSRSAPPMQFGCPTTLIDPPHPTTLTEHHESTRQTIIRLLLESGPMTAGQIGTQLGLAAPGVRRHLDVLIDSGDVETHTPKPHLHTRRGRPAKKFQLTPSGRDKLGHAYDDLAVAALHQLRAVGGKELLCDFARQRIQNILAEVTPVPVEEVSNHNIESVVNAIVTALNKAGYTAATHKIDGKISGIQILQHHCPIASVAREFPELCQAEDQVIADLLHTHIQRLATIANGNYMCTTHIPLPRQTFIAEHHTPAC